MTYPLNPEQEVAAEAIDGNVVTIAGPGTGKTTVLIDRYLRMITKHRIPATDILNLTFTSEAAKNMVERVGLFGAKEVFRTFHSFALDLIMKERERLPFKANDFILPQQGQDFQLLRNLMKTYPAISSFRTLKDEIARWKASNVAPEQAMEEMYYDKKGGFYLACAYRDYEVKCRQEGWLDFDSLMRETVKLLETNDDVRRRWVRRYICVDECQDTDVTQFKLLQLIYGGNIFVVGDENQLIYEWRSAVAGNLTNFAQQFPGASMLFLGANYRSTGAIVEFLKRILPVDNGIASHMRSMREYGEKPTFRKYDSDLHEAEGTIRKLITLDPNETAVIARTNRQLRTFQKACAARNIRTMILGQKDLWQTNEVKHLLDLTKEHKDSPRPAHEVMTELMTQHNMMYTYRSTGGPNEKPPVENLADIIKLSAKRGTVAEFLSWLRKLTFACDAAKSPSYQHKDKNPTLALTTVHQAKGREWKNVFVIGARQGMMPHADGEILEEKRIFYVACSRAADFLQISYDGNRSEFLNDFQEEIKYEQIEHQHRPPTSAGSAINQASAAEVDFS